MPEKFGLKDQIMFAVIVAIFMGMGFYLLVAEPKMRELDKVSKELITREKTFKSTARRGGMGYEGLLGQMADIEKQLEDLQPRFLTRRELRSFLVDLQSKIEQSGIEVISMDAGNPSRVSNLPPGTETNPIDHECISVDLKMRGDYYDMMVLFQELDKDEKIFHVKDIKITPDKDHPSGVNVSFSLNLYLVVTEEPDFDLIG